MASYGLYFGLMVVSLTALVFFILIVAEVEVELMSIIGIVTTSLISIILMYLIWRKSKGNNKTDEEFNYNDQNSYIIEPKIRDY